jgi:hypothetical protein
MSDSIEKASFQFSPCLVYIIRKWKKNLIYYNPTWLECISLSHVHPCLTKIKEEEKIIKYTYKERKGRLEKKREEL